jgi:hypothetical protein
MLLVVFASVVLASGAVLAGRPKVQDVPGGAQEMQTGIPVARVYGTGPGVEALKANRWSALADGTLVKTGDRLRTGSAAAALKFPWTTLIVSPGTMLGIPPSIVLTANLDEGRVEQRAVGDDIIKMRTPEAVVRGSGHLIVRRQHGKTFVSALEGAFDVATGAGTVRLDGGYGTVVLRGERPTRPAELPAAKVAMYPGPDPVYFRRDRPVQLRWESLAGQHYVQVREFESDQLVHAADVAGAEHSLTLPLGLFRGRLATSAPDAPDGKPSADGFICVVEE